MKVSKFDFNFKLLIISKIISVFGGNILAFAMILFLVDLTGSAAVLGVTFAVSQLPTIVTMPFAGVLADRLDKKKLIVLFDVITAATNFYFLWLLVSGNYSVFNITVLRMVKMGINTFAATVFNAAVPRIVDEEQLVGANGILQSIAAIGLIGGSVVGGILFGVIAIETIAFASGVLFLVSAAISLKIRIPYVRRKLDDGIVATVKRDMVESFTFLRTEKPIIFQLALVSTANSFLFPPIFMVGLPFLVGVVFGQEVTLSFGIAAVGMLLGGVLAGRLTNLLAIRYLPRWTAGIGVAGLLLVLAFSPLVPDLTVAFWMFNFSLALLLLIFALTSSSFGAFTQQQVPEHLLGKVNSLLAMISLVAGPIGMLAVGFLIEVMPLSLFFFGVSAITWLVAGICGMMLRNYFRSEGAKGL